VGKEFTILELEGHCNSLEEGDLRKVLLHSLASGTRTNLDLGVVGTIPRTADYKVEELHYTTHLLAGQRKAIATA